MIEKIIELYSLGRYTAITTLINIAVGIGIFYYLYRSDIKIEKIYRIALIWGSTGILVRFIADITFIPMPWRLVFITPFIYIEMFLFGLIAKDRILLACIISVPALFYILLYIEKVNIIYGLIIALFTAILYTSSLLLLRHKKFSLVVTAQGLDGFTTFFSLTYLNFYEEHILANYIISFAEKYLFTINESGAWFFMLAKVVFSLLFIKVVKKEKNERLQDLALLFATFLGFVTGTRNALNIIFKG